MGMAEIIISFPNVIQFKSKNFLQLSAMKMHSIPPHTLSSQILKHRGGFFVLFLSKKKSRELCKLFLSGSNTPFSTNEIQSFMFEVWGGSYGQRLTGIAPNYPNQRCNLPIFNLSSRKWWLYFPQAKLHLLIQCLKDRTRSKARAKVWWENLKERNKL